MNHHQNSAGEILLPWLIIPVLGAGAAAYLIGLWRTRNRSSWPAHRTVAWFLGLGCIGAGLAGPMAAPAQASFTAHMVGHLLLGMAAPLLLVLATPVTLALRALPVEAARGLSTCLHSIVVRCVSHPLVAGVLAIGGLWLLYTTDLYRLMHASALVSGLVHIHVVVSGYLFTASIVGRDPNPHRSSMLVRSSVLVAFIALHSILAKWLYAHPPAGVEASDAQAGALVMYFGGDAVDLALIVLLFAGWYRATRPRGSLPGPSCTANTPGR